MKSLFLFFCQGPETSTTEIACSTDTGGTITTGGGFSELCPVQDWQTNHTIEYFNTVTGTDLEPHIGYAGGGRGLPDVSLAAENYAIYIGGSLIGVSGTSASCPAFAGMISLINARRMESGLSSVGWINPTLYAYSESFTKDITSGNNKCCAVDITCCAQGFTAVSGWDPVTGLGSVNYESMLEVFLSLGNDLNVPTATPTPGGSNPSETPTLEPTLAPSTFAPTVAPGWLGLGFYSDSDCSGTLYTSTGVAINKCFALYKDNIFEDKYVKYSCTNGKNYCKLFAEVC